MNRHTQEHIQREQYRHVHNRAKFLERFNREGIVWWESAGRVELHRFNKRNKHYRHHMYFWEHDDWYLEGKFLDRLRMQESEQREYGRTFARRVSVKEEARK